MYPQWLVLLLLCSRTVCTSLSTECLTLQHSHRKVPDSVLAAIRARQAHNIGAAVFACLANDLKFLATHVLHGRIVLVLNKVKAAPHVQHVVGDVHGSTHVDRCSGAHALKRGFGWADMDSARVAIRPDGKRGDDPVLRMPDEHIVSRVGENLLIPGPPAAPVRGRGEPKARLQVFGSEGDELRLDHIGRRELSRKADRARLRHGRADGVDSEEQGSEDAAPDGESFRPSTQPPCDGAHTRSSTQPP
mmetsp:Transcript_48974/g.104573  ORF Transcript_48974/g.104573 Transcript_48974/m.104573 type:complete len:247 (-) Transcript_48974:29-769(-)